MKRIIKNTVTAAAHSQGYDVKFTKIRPTNEIYFLHIGKNAGTQIMSICEKVNNKNCKKISKQGHDVYLQHIPREAQYFFSIRDPINRFLSGFYSRKRKGQPRIYSEWSEFENKAFSDFEHANELAESIFASGQVGARAFCAMKSITHTAQNQSDWFCKTGNFLSSRPPIWIIRQNNLQNDMAELFKRADLYFDEEDIEPERDTTKAHANNYSSTPKISEKAKENLKIWYAQDFEFYQACEQWILEELRRT